MFNLITEDLGTADLLLDVDAGIRRLSEQDAESAELVKLRIFAGLSVAEARENLGLSRTRFLCKVAVCQILVRCLFSRLIRNLRPSPPVGLLGEPPYAYPRHPRSSLSWPGRQAEQRRHAGPAPAEVVLKKWPRLR